MELVQQIINELRVQRDHMVQKDIQYEFLLELLGLPTRGYAEDYKKLHHPTKLPIPPGLHGMRYPGDIRSQPPYIQLKSSLISQTDTYDQSRLDARSLYSTMGEDTEPTPVASQFAPPTLVSHLAPPITASRGTQSTPVTRQSTLPKLWASIDNHTVKKELRARLLYQLCVGEINPNKHSLSEIRLVWLTNWIYSDDPSELCRREEFVMNKWLKDKHFKPFVVLDGVETQWGKNLCSPHQRFQSKAESEAVGDSDYLYRLSGNEAGSLAVFIKGKMRFRIGYEKLDQQLLKFNKAEMKTNFYSAAF